MAVSKSCWSWRHYRDQIHSQCMYTWSLYFAFILIYYCFLRRLHNQMPSSTEPIFAPGFLEKQHHGQRPNRITHVNFLCVHFNDFVRFTLLGDHSAWFAFWRGQFRYSTFGGWVLGLENVQWPGSHFSPLQFWQIWQPYCGHHASAWKISTTQPGGLLERKRSIFYFLSLFERSKNNAQRSSIFHESFVSSSSLDLHYTAVDHDG